MNILLRINGLNSVGKLVSVFVGVLFCIVPGLSFDQDFLRPRFVKIERLEKQMFPDIFRDSGKLECGDGCLILEQNVARDCSSLF